MRIKKKCEWCGSEYHTGNGKAKYCSDECRREAHRDKQKQWHENHPSYQKDYRKNHPEVAERFKENHPNYERDRWRRIRGTVIHKRECVVCGKGFETPYPRANTCSPGCSRLGKAYRRSNRIARLRENGKVAADITLDKLIERDEGVCHICGKKVDNDDFGRKDGHWITGHKYPTIDHVVPISKGGTHTWDNVKLAHMICNSRKGSFLVR